jgi:putative selenate reductase molybdopterin-binding subunit
MTQALGYTLSEEMVYDDEGQPREKDFVDYHIFQADEMPDLGTVFVETFEPSHPFGVKSVAEIPIDAVAPAVGNAIIDACGAELTTIPAIPERVWRSLKGLSN